MRTVFADTGYWVAFINRQDPYHHKVKELGDALKDVRILTSEVVLIELLTYFSNKGEFFRKIAVAALKNIQQDPLIVVVPQTKALFESTVIRYDKMSDKLWSFTDCCSFEIMKAKRIREALAHDKHFVQAGFVALLR